MVEIIKEKLSSRKLWIGAALVIVGAVLCAVGDTHNGVTVICIGAGGYLGAETICDIVRGIFQQDTTDDIEVVEYTLDDLIAAEAEEE